MQMAANNSCGVCFEAPHKYKCPKCYVKYCSVPCYKKHTSADAEFGCNPKAQDDESKREILPPTTSQVGFAIDTAKSASFPSDGSVTESTVAPEKLQLLRNDEGILNCLRNPHLRDLMQRLNAAEDPAKELHAAMLEPLFARVADHCLRVVDDGGEKRPSGGDILHLDGLNCA